MYCYALWGNVIPMNYGEIYFNVSGGNVFLSIMEKCYSKALWRNISEYIMENVSLCMEKYISL